MLLAVWQSDFKLPVVAARAVCSSSAGTLGSASADKHCSAAVQDRQDAAAVQAVFLLRASPDDSADVRF
jgi:hypothetical protein